jgi:hypothetical protein
MMVGNRSKSTTLILLTVLLQRGKKWQRNDPLRGRSQADQLSADRTGLELHRKVVLAVEGSPGWNLDIPGSGSRKTKSLWMT